MEKLTDAKKAFQKIERINRFDFLVNILIETKEDYFVFYEQIQPVLAAILTFGWEMNSKEFIFEEFNQNGYSNGIYVNIKLCSNNKFQVGFTYCEKPDYVFKPQTYKVELL